MPSDYQSLLESEYPPPYYIPSDYYNYDDDYGYEGPEMEAGGDNDKTDSYRGSAGVISR